MKKIVTLLGMMIASSDMDAKQYMVYESGVIQPALNIAQQKCKSCAVKKSLPIRHNQRVTQKYSRNTHEQRISVEIINRLLANLSVLLFQTLHYHWNLRGPEFNDYHGLLDNQYKALFTQVDLAAERVRAVGGNALGSMHQMIRHATISEDAGTRIPGPRQMIANLHDQYLRIIQEIRRDIATLDHKTHDHGSKKMLEDLIEQFEKSAWMLRALLGYQ